MSDDKAISVQALATFLVQRGLAEAQAGYGHASAEQVAREVFQWLTERDAEHDADIWDQGWEAGADDQKRWGGDDEWHGPTTNPHR